MAYQVSSPHLFDSAPNILLPDVDKIITSVFQKTNYHFQENNGPCASFTLLFELTFKLIWTNLDAKTSGYAENPDNWIFLRK